jgi:hypothetical protein
MPTMRIKEVRLPELHLPEMSRDDITRAIGDATRDIDLTRLDPRRVDLPEVAADLSRELSKIDLPKAVASAATVGRPQRSRLPFVIGGLITLGLVAFAVASSPILRSAWRRSRARTLAPSTPRSPCRSSRPRSARMHRRPTARSMDRHRCPMGSAPPSPTSRPRWRTRPAPDRIDLISG